MFCRRTFLNPCSSALTSYRPADRLGNVKNPVASLTAVRGIWVAVAVTVTVAPGTTAPCASLMVPEICPRSSWAAAGAATPSAHATTRAQRRTTRAEKYIYVLLLVPFTRYAWPENYDGVPPVSRYVIASWSSGAPVRRGPSPRAPSPPSSASARDTGCRP